MPPRFVGRVWTVGCIRGVSATVMSMARLGSPVSLGTSTLILGRYGPVRSGRPCALRVMSGMVCVGIAVVCLLARPSHIVEHVQCVQQGYSDQRFAAGRSTSCLYRQICWT